MGSRIIETKFSPLATDCGELMTDSNVKLWRECIYAVTFRTARVNLKLVFHNGVLVFKIHIYAYRVYTWYTFTKVNHK